MSDEHTRRVRPNTVSLILPQIKSRHSLRPGDRVRESETTSNQKGTRQEYRRRRQLRWCEPDGI
jgi:hypothetical protein